LYSEETVDLNRKVNVNVNNEDINSLLNQVLKGTNNYYEIFDRQIAFMSKKNPVSPVFKPVEEIPTIEPAPQNEVKGTVKDKNGVPLPGGTIIVKGTTIGTVTDFDGNYTLTRVPDNAILVYSFVGLESQEVPIPASVIHIVLEETTTGLEKWLCVGTVFKRRVSKDGAISTVGTDELRQSSAPNLSVAWQVSCRFNGHANFRSAGERRSKPLP
jgi:hypothetical protein